MTQKVSRKNQIGCVGGLDRGSGMPGMPVGSVGGWIPIGMGVSVGAVGRDGRGDLVKAIVEGRHESGDLDLLVHVGLEESIEALAFTRNIVGGHQLCLNGDAELVGRETGQAEALAVI